MLWDPSKDKPIEPILDEIGQIMMLAADYLETHRWGQGDFVLANGAVCLMGALIKVEVGKVYSYKKDDEQESYCFRTNLAIDRVGNYINKGSTKYSSGYKKPSDWNDDPKRKKSEVIAVLREAAKLK